MVFPFAASSGCSSTSAALAPGPADDEPLASTRGLSPAEGRWLRDWAARLRSPGAWSPQAWCLVAPLLLRLPQWSAGTLRVEVDGDVHHYQPEAVASASNEGAVWVCRDLRTDLWYVKPGTPGGAFVAVSLKQPGDGFLRAVLEALSRLDLSETAWPSDPTALRQVLADLIEEGVRAAHDAPHAASWLTTLLDRPAEPLASRTVTRAPRHPPVKAAEVSTVATGEPRARPKTMARSVHVVPGSPPGPSQIRAIEVALKAKDLARSCQMIQALRPHSDVPLWLVERLCSLAVELQREDVAATLIERLSASSSALFRSDLGLSEERRLLDLHVGALHPPFPEGHVNACPSDVGLPVSVSRVLFHLHARRGTLGPHCFVVVGRHGSGMLRSAIADCIREWGWEPAEPVSSHLGHGARGVLMVLEPDQPLPSSARSLVTGNPSFLSERLRACVSLEGVGVEGSEAWQRTHRALRCALYSIPPGEALAILEHSATASLEFYEMVAKRAILTNRLSDFEAALQAATARWGEVPRESIGRMMMTTTSTAAEVTGPVLQSLINRLARSASGLVPEDFIALLAATSHWRGLADVVSLYDEQVAHGLRPTPDLLRHFIRCSAQARSVSVMRRFEAELRRSGEPDGVHVQLSRALMAARRDAVDDAREQLTRIWQGGGHADLQTVKALLEGFGRAGRYADGVDLLEASLAHGDPAYQPTLGYQVDAAGRPHIALRAQCVHATAFSHLPGRVRFLSLEEFQVLVDAHGRRGHLQPGVQVSLPSRNCTDEAACVRERVRAWGLGMEKQRDKDGAVTGHWRLVSVVPADDGAGPELPREGRY